MRPRSLLSVSLAFAALFLAPAVQAQIFVDTTVDEADGSCSDGDCSLRDAIALAPPPPSGVAVLPGTYVLTLGQITIDRDLIIAALDPRTTIVDGNNASRIFETAPGTEVVLAGLTLTRGNATDGGAVLSRGTLTLVVCTVKDNTASGDGGGIAAGELNIDRSTFSGNVAARGGGIARVALGLHTIFNSTVSGNSATGRGGAWGCGEQGGDLTVLNSTLTGNSAADGADAIDFSCSRPALTLVNTIIAGNGENLSPDCFTGNGTVTTSHVLAGDDSCTRGGPGDLPSTAALLGPLANNGSPTDTHLPGAGSPALDAADSAVCAAPPVNGEDQRFISRPQGTGCDIGAVEVEVVLNAPPVCSGATPSVARIWPPDHKMAQVSIQGVTDPDGDAVTIVIDQVRQDESTNGAGDGNTCPDAQGLGTATASVRAERNGQGNGRVYTLSFTATDEQGATCQGSVQVCVPHSSGGSCVNGGPLNDSSVCSGVTPAQSPMTSTHSHKSLGDLHSATDGLNLICGSHFPTLACDLQCDAGVLLCN
jgi:CSLREA domain-containing protein